jgi:hypothetical protein
MLPSRLRRDRLNSMSIDKSKEPFGDCVEALELLDDDSEKRLIEAYERDADTAKPESD